MLIITRIYPKYLLAGKAIYGDCSSARKSTLKGWYKIALSLSNVLPKHLAIAASRAIVQSLMQSNLMIFLRIGTIRLLGCGWGPVSVKREPEVTEAVPLWFITNPLCLATWPIGHCDQRKPNRAFSDFINYLSGQLKYI